MRHRDENPRPRLADLDELELVVEKLIAGGDGFARWNGIPIFVPRSVPGDRLRVRLVERQRDYGRAEIVEILEEGPGRRIAPCAFFGRCGGCDLQHIEDELQAKLKAAAVHETLVRLGGVSSDIPLEIILGSPWGYRQRAQVHSSTDGEQVRIGFHPRRGHELVAVDSCPVLVPELEQVLGTLPRRLPTPPPERLDLLVGDAAALSTAPRTETLPHGAVEISVGDFTYALDARCFFQSHRQLLPRLVQEVVGEWRGREAYDLFAGVGFFSLPLAGLYDRVVAVEGDRTSGRYLQRNSRRARTEGLDYVHSAIESWITQLPDRVDRVIVDPPRMGLSGKIKEYLCQRRPRQLTYASCHPATLARDLKGLDRSFKIDSLSLIDLFPQTGHMEVVAQLSSK